ncbi:MAG: hypothetical protein M1822_004440 [Bathelium mastoideum]|nr:MAG: hypothetical protein M1822_004440 [Bathelium mastoideum]
MLLQSIFLFAITATIFSAEAVLPREALSQPVTNVTDIPISSSKTPSNTSSASTSKFCCEVIATSVAFNEWWTSSYEVTVATVITTYLQYDDKLIPANSTTIYNTSATSVILGGDITTDLYGLFLDFPGLSGPLPPEFYPPILPGVPTDLAPNDLAQGYDGTSILKGTEAVFTVDDGSLTNVFTMTSPTPFWEFNSVGIIEGEPYQASSGASWGCPFSYANFFDAVIATALPDPVAYANVPQSLVDYLALQPGFAQSYPSVVSCIAGSGMGEPTVHIPVNELTDTQSATVRVPGYAPGSRASSSSGYNGNGGQGNSGSNTLVGASGGMTTSVGGPLPPTQPAQPHTTTQAVASPTVTTLPNPISTLPMGTDSIEPAPPPEGQSSLSVSPQKAPQSIDNSGGDVVNTGQPQSRKPGGVLDTRPESSSGEVTSQVADPLPHGLEGPPTVSGTVGSSNAVPVQILGGSVGQTSNSDGTLQAGDEAGANGVSVLKLPGEGNQAATNGAGNSGGSVNGQGNEHSVPNYINNGQPSMTTIPPVIIGGVIATPLAPSTYILPEDQTISAGGAPVITAGKKLSLATSGAVIINGQTVSSIAAYHPEPGPITFGNAIATPLGSNAVVIGGQTLSLGGTPVIESGTTYSLDPSSAVVVNGQTLSKLSTYLNPTPITISNAAFTPLGSDAYAVGGQTLDAGGTPITVFGSTYSLAPSGAIVLNGQTVSSLPVDIGYGHPISGAITALTLGTAVFTATPAVGSALVIDDQTLLPGHAITVTQNGQVEAISVPSDGLADGGYIGVVNGVTQSLVPGQWLLTEPDGVVLTLSPTGVGELVVGGTTLVPGGMAITSGGLTISEASNGDVVEASGGVTSKVGSASGSGSGGVGYYVHSGFGGGTTSAPAAFLGEGARLRDVSWLKLGLIAAFGIGTLVL